jgi:hypothetical protein
LVNKSGQQLCDMLTPAVKRAPLPSGYQLTQNIAGLPTPMGDLVECKLDFSGPATEVMTGMSAHGSNIYVEMLTGDQHLSRRASFGLYPTYLPTVGITLVGQYAAYSAAAARASTKMPHARIAAQIAQAILRTAANG